MMTTSNTGQHDQELAFDPDVHDPQGRRNALHKQADGGVIIAMRCVQCDFIYCCGTNCAENATFSPCLPPCFSDMEAFIRYTVAFLESHGYAVTRRA